MRIANAPTSWGVEDPKSTLNPPWQFVLSEIAAAGYAGTELGPYGYMPTRPDVLRRALSDAGLALVGGTILHLFHSEDSSKELQARVRAICQTLRANDAPYLVAISGMSTHRIHTAGQADTAERLTSAEFARACDMLNRLGEIAASEGTALTLHSHAGTHIEFADELDRVLDRTDPSVVGLCVDTGHAAYAGIDPVALVETHTSRVRYIHLKDIDPAVHFRAVTEKMSFWDAYSAGVFCPIGQGAIDFAGLFAALDRIGYRGWYTVEQDAHPSQSNQAVEWARRSLEYIRSLIPS